MTTGYRPLPPDSGGPTIAIAAHEGSRKDLIGLLCRFVHMLERCQLVAISPTALECMKDVGLPAESVAGGIYEGNLRVDALALAGSLDAFVFLRDPLQAPGSDADLLALARAYDLGNVPSATNLAAAQALLAQLNSDISRKEERRLNGKDSDGEYPRAKESVLHSS